MQKTIVELKNQMMKSIGTPVVLTNDSGVALTEDSQLTGMYDIVSSGAETVYYYISHNGTFEGEIIVNRFTVNAAVTLRAKLEVLALGASEWRSIPPHDSGVIAADGSSQDMNGSYPLRELITLGTQVRVAITVSGACTSGVQVVKT